MWANAFVGNNRDLNSSESTLQSIGQYIENYIDLVENVPNDIVRQITRLHEHNRHFHISLARLESALAISRCEGHASQRRPKHGLAAVQRCLAEIQAISDEKLQIVQTIYDHLETKARQLEQDCRTVNASNGSTNLISPIKMTTSNRENAREASFFANSKVTENVNGNNPVSSGSSDEGVENNRPGKDQETVTDNGVAKQFPSSVSNNSIASTRADDEEDGDADFTEANGNSRASPPLGKRPRRAAQNNVKVKEQHVPVVEKKHKEVIEKVKVEKPVNSPVKRVMKRQFKTTTKESKRSRRDANSPPPSIYEEKTDPDEPTYCLCEQISFGEMIGCDNDSCVLEWFHFQCVNLTSKPKGKWYCPHCRGDRCNVPKK
jgi:inhibitor-of-growth protein 1